MDGKVTTKEVSNIEILARVQTDGDSTKAIGFGVQEAIGISEKRILRK